MPLSTSTYCAGQQQTNVNLLDASARLPHILGAPSVPQPPPRQPAALGPHLPAPPGQRGVSPAPASWEDAGICWVTRDTCSHSKQGELTPHGASLDQGGMEPADKRLLFQSFWQRTEAHPTGLLGRPQWNSGAAVSSGKWGRAAFPSPSPLLGPSRAPPHQFLKQTAWTQGPVPAPLCGKIKAKTLQFPA